MAFKTLRMHAYLEQQKRGERVFLSDSPCFVQDLSPAVSSSCTWGWESRRNPCKLIGLNDFVTATRALYGYPKWLLCGGESYNGECAVESREMNV